MLKNEFGDTVYTEARNVYLRMDEAWMVGADGGSALDDVLAVTTVNSAAHRCLVWHAVGHLLRMGLTSRGISAQFDELCASLVVEAPQCLDVGLTGFRREVYFTVLLTGASVYMGSLEVGVRGDAMKCSIASLRERLEECAFAAGEAGNERVKDLTLRLGHGDQSAATELLAFLKEHLGKEAEEAEEHIWGSTPDIYTTEVAQA